jgi:hypothetical protein
VIVLRGRWIPNSLIERFSTPSKGRTGTEVNLITNPVITVPFRPIAPPDLANGKVSPGSQINLSLGTEFVYVRKSILAPEGECHTRGLTSGAFTFRAERTPWWDDIVHCEVLEVKENERLVYTWLGSKDRAQTPMALKCGGH